MSGPRNQGQLVTCFLCNRKDLAYRSEWSTVARGVSVWICSGCKADPVAAWEERRAQGGALARSRRGRSSR